MPAQTIDEYSSNFTATITIDKGRDEGIDVGFPVVGAGGLVGQVIQRFAHTSVVRLITDGQSKVGVTFGNQLTGIVDGQGPGNDLTLDLVAPGTPVVKGEKLVTSGLDAASPSRPGIPVEAHRARSTQRRAPSRGTIVGGPDGRPEPARVRRSRAVGAADVSSALRRPDQPSSSSCGADGPAVDGAGCAPGPVASTLTCSGSCPSPPRCSTAARRRAPWSGSGPGLAFDLVLPTPFGLSALVATLLGYSTGYDHGGSRPPRPVVAEADGPALIGAVGADMLFAVLGAILGQQEMVGIDFVAAPGRGGGDVLGHFWSCRSCTALMRWSLTGESNRRSLVETQSSEASV